MKMWIYQLKKDENQAFCVQEHRLLPVDNGKTKYTIWHDQFEGGYAYDSDWLCVSSKQTYPSKDDCAVECVKYPNLPDSDEFSSFDEAL